MLNNNELIAHNDIQDNNLPRQGEILRQDFFADDTSDEFQVMRENGRRQGIFKVWAAPVIAELENTDPVTWANQLRNKPLSLFECLETWRASAAEADRDLQGIFNHENLPGLPIPAAAELFARLTAAFKATAPFYHIEALVADNRANKPDNPIDFAEDSIVAGKLDAVAMLLPAAIKNLVVAVPGNWNGLSWEQISHNIELLDVPHEENKKDAPHIRELLLKVANLASLDIETVVFAANALEFIPQQVGGKTTDFTQQEAMRLLVHVLDEPSQATTTTKIAKDMNAMIRFLNWTPAIRSDANFMGQGWMYDSVCATASELLELIRDNSDFFFDTDFNATFKNELLPQLDGIDATSAKGRFMLQLLHEGAFNSGVAQHIGAVINQRVPQHLANLSEFRRDVDFEDFSLVSKIGGKAMGLKTAREIFGEQVVAPSRIIPVDAVNRWLLGIDKTQELLQKLEQDVEARASTAEQIRQLIIQAEPPHELLESFVKTIDGEGGSRLAFRSSSFDEDVDLIGPAPGIYDSVIDIDISNRQAVGEAFKTVVASFFTTKAVHFRDAKELRHKPVMAVLGQRMIDGPGGSIFIEKGNITANIASAPAVINDHDQASKVQRITLSLNGSTGQMQETTEMIAESVLIQLTELARKAESILGPVDMEFVFDTANKKLTVLQLRRLERFVPPATKKSLGRTMLLPASRLQELDTVVGEEVTLVVEPSDDVEKFQGELFKSIIANRDKITGVMVPEMLPPTCHFVNILMTMGITVEFSGEHDE